MNSNETVAQQLAAFIGALDYDQLSAGVTRYGKTLLLDQLGCQLIGSTVDWNQTAYRFITENQKRWRCHRCQLRQQGSRR
jgi:2-methylcitrate dehydratase PrpD